MARSAEQHRRRPELVHADVGEDLRTLRPRLEDEVLRRLRDEDRAFAQLQRTGRNGRAHVHVPGGLDEVRDRSARQPSGRPPARPLRRAAGLRRADPNTAGTYDTIYVDLDGDHDFTGEKAVTQASPASYTDLTGDGLADISGGLLTFISDGTSTTVPGGPDFFGAGVMDRDEFLAGNIVLVPPASGELVVWSGDYDPGIGGHGTLTASNVVGQGRAKGLAPTFTDLRPGRLARRRAAARPTRSCCRSATSTSRSTRRRSSATSSRTWPESTRRRTPTATRTPTTTASTPPARKPTSSTTCSATARRCSARPATARRGTARRTRPAPPRASRLAPRRTTARPAGTRSSRPRRSSATTWWSGRIAGPRHRQHGRRPRRQRRTRAGRQHAQLGLRRQQRVGDLGRHEPLDAGHGGGHGPDLPGLPLRARQRAGLQHRQVDPAVLGRGPRLRQLDAGRRLARRGRGGRSLARPGRRRSRVAQQLARGRLPRHGVPTSSRTCSRRARATRSRSRSPARARGRSATGSSSAPGARRSGSRASRSRTSRRTTSTRRTTWSTSPIA